ARAVDAELEGAVAALARLLHARPLDARHAAGVFHPRRHLGFQPAHRILSGRAGIHEGPGPAAPVTVAARRAGRRVGRTLDRARIVPAAPGEAGPGAPRPRRGDDRHPPDPHEQAPHSPRTPLEIAAT